MRGTTYFCYPTDVHEYITITREVLNVRWWKNIKKNSLGPFVENIAVTFGTGRLGNQVHSNTFFFVEILFLVLQITT